jgi:glycosyltransferase involved in cell wall biosynthesis
LNKIPKRPAISVVIPAFNEEHFIKKTLDSIFNQSITDFEVIVVDNGSTDRTRMIASELGALVIIENEKGVGAARHRGFLDAKGEIIATTDADTVVPNNWLEEIVRAFQDNPELVAFGGLARLYSGPITARIATRFLYHPFMLIDNFLSGGWSLCGNNMAIRQEAYLTVGGFRTDLVIGEDVEISKRLAGIGQVCLSKQLLVYTSGRRFRYGLLHGLMTYAPSTIMRLFFRKEMFISFSDVRDEYPSSDL